MWFKKKSVLQAEHHYDTEKSADGSTDMRTTYKDYNNSSINSGLPSAADAGNYFYLPALGFYDSGQLFSIGYIGSRWSSSAVSWYNGYAYKMHFNSGSVSVNFNNRNYGLRGDGGFE